MDLSFKKTKEKRHPLLGAHMSIAGGTPRAIERAREADCNVLQIFVKNANRWTGKPLTDAEAEEFHQSWAESPLWRIVAHAGYLINPAASEGSLRRQSIQALEDELQRCDRLGLDFLVLHPGAHTGNGEAAGIRLIAEALDAAHEVQPLEHVRVALEHTAGQGSALGYRFEHLRDILSASRYSDRLFICLDSCHLFAAGYDLRQEEVYRQTFEEFDRIVGLERLKVFHLNDSLKDFGSRVDRHAHIGEGRIGTQAFALILNDPRLADVPKIIETPKGDPPRLELDLKNLNLLRSLAGAP